ncbi:MAG TPA: hypothetical protein VNE16_10675 [Vicinamibacterales bacterium]|nr:hypothetical protein [Vicinamibacterales bacterium]
MKTLVRASGGPKPAGCRAGRLAGRLALALALLGGGAGAAEATTMIAMPLPTLTASAGAILQGRVTDVQSHWNASRTHIFTFATVHVTRYLKGNLGPDVTVMEFGGEVAGMIQMIPGVPQFQPGEDVVLFLSLHSPMYPAVLALSQGKFDIVRDPATGQQMLSRSLYGASLQGPGDPLNRPLSLSAFENRIEALVHPHPAAERKPKKK